MANRLMTEDGSYLVQETISGLTGASSFNDTRVETINKEYFITDPLLDGWLIGTDWSWNPTNQNME